ncbi:MAG: ImpA family metalloprotease [Stagnimonas sp.]|nr:ImpA family metalloprotease [Stagnimonas sp.]
MHACKLLGLAAVLSLSACGGGGSTDGPDTAGTPTILAPTLTLSANPATVASGGSSTLTWNSANASSCTASGAWSGSQSVSGSKAVSAPTVPGDYTYTLACTGAGGSISKNAVVTVATGPALTFSANPTSVASGETSTLSWNSANTTSCTASGAWNGSQSVSGSRAVSAPTVPGDYTYTLACTGAGGSVSKNAVVTVVAPAPTLTLGANPSTVASGTSSTLTWSSSNATACTASGAWTGNQNPNGSQAVIPPAAAGNYTYTLACTGAGGSVSKSAVVTVAPAPTLNFGASPATVTSGASSTLSWSSANASSCTASGSWSGSQVVSGSKSVTPPATAGDHTYTLACTGSGGSVSKNAVVTVAPAVAADPNSCYDPANPSNKPSTDRVDAAVKSGDPSGLQSAADRPTLLECATRKATALRARPQQVLAEVYGNVDLSINIGNFTTSIKSTGLSGAIPYIVSDKGTGIAAIVELAGDSKTGRGIAYGADVLSWMSGTSKEQQHLPLFTRAFTWLLTGSASGTLPATIKFSQTAYSANSVKNFVARLPGKTATEVVCDITDPANTCWQGLDLLVFGEGVKDKGGLEDLVRTYLKAGKSVIYMHNDWNISTGGIALLGGMGMMSANSVPGDGPGNYFESPDAYSVASGRTAADSLARADQVSRLITALDLLQQPSYTKDFAADTTPVDGINLALNEIAGLEGRGKKLFAVENTTLYRLLVLWADEMRPDISYGSAQLNRTNYPADFLRAYASDSWLAYNRSKTTTNPNGQGDYMPQVAQSLTVSTADETLVLTLPQGSGKTAIGRGAIPAKAVAVTVVGVKNKDGTAATGVNLGLQTSYIRTRGNPLKDSNNYARPRQPNSWSVLLQSGVVNDFISPAGGPLFLNYSGATAGQQVTLKIKGVVRYAHFDFANGTPPQAELDAAMAALQRQDYGWSTFKFRGGELQQTVATALKSFKFGMPAGQLRTPQDLVTQRVEGILMDTNHLANGYNDMAMSATVSSLCTAFNWDCSGSMHNAPGVQHFVSWLPACGSGCSGQPIDNDNWAMDIGWGWPHELGHNTVQRWMSVVIDGKGCSTECDNNTLSSAHMLRRYAVLGEDASGANTDHAALYKMIQDNRATLMIGEPLRADMQARLWGGPEQRPMLAMYYQLAFLYTQARHGLAQPSADTTIEFLTLLSKGGHLVSKSWSAAAAASYGMSRYSSNSIPNHELLYVLGSRIIGQDLRNVFSMYGVPLSQTALDSVADLGGAVAPLRFYALAAGKANQLATGQWLSLPAPPAQAPAYPF